MPHEPLTYRRADLYAEVWAEPLLKVAQRHGISDVALGELCRRLNVPVPGRGYWAKVAAGRMVARPRLPEAAKGLGEEVTINRWIPAHRRSGPATKPRPIPALPVPIALSDTHPLVAVAQRRLEGRKPDTDGLVRCTARQCLSVEVSPGLLGRALLLFDTLIKACAARGMAFEVTPLAPEDAPPPRRDWYGQPEQPSPYNQTRVQVDGVWIAVALQERRDEERDPPPTPPKDLTGYQRDWWNRDHAPKVRHIPNGRLYLALTSTSERATWWDHRVTKIESKLGEVIERLPALAAEVKRVREEAEARERARREEQKRRDEAERRAIEERKRGEDIQEQLRRWRLASDLRAYVSECERLVENAECEVTPGGSLERDNRWALDYAERIDPYTSLRRELAQLRMNRETGKDEPPGEGTRWSPRAR
jgi:hypothetical protein